MTAAPAPDSPHWWQTRWFVVAMALLAMVPLVWPHTPPLVDLPGHMGRYRVQLDIGHDPWFKDWYSFHWSLIGNLGVDLLVIPLSKVFGLELAVKLIVMTIPALTVTGLLWIAREVHGRIPATALFALPLAYSYPFHFGFINFALSMALALNAFALWLRLARLDRIRFRAALFVPISCLLWICHTYGWGTLGVLAFSAELVRIHDKGHGWIKSWFLAVPQCLPLCLPIGMMILWRGGQVSGETGDWFNWRIKLGWIVMTLRDRWRIFDVASTAVLLLILFKGFRDPGLQYSRNLGLSAIFLLIVFICMPRVVFGSAYADMRLAPYMIAIGVTAIRPRLELSARRKALLAAAGLAFFAVRTTATTISFWLYGRSYDRELEAVSHIPIGARVIGLVGMPCTYPWFTSRLDHLPAFALERRLAFSNDQWAIGGAQLLTTHYRAAGDFSNDPSQLVTRTGCHRDVWKTISNALETFPHDAFDYLWLIDPPAYRAKDTVGLVPVWRSESSILFRVAHDDRESPPRRALPRAQDRR